MIKIKKKRSFTRLKALNERIYFDLIKAKHRNKLIQKDLALFYTLLYFFKAKPNSILSLTSENFKVGTIYLHVQIKNTWQRVVINSNIEPILNLGLQFPFLLLNRLVSPARCIQKFSKRLCLLAKV